MIKGSHILVICAEGIGNTLLTLPALQALKDQGNRLDLVVADNGSAEIIDLVNVAERVFVWKLSSYWLWNCVRLGMSFCCQRYDIAYAACPAGKKANVLLRMANAKTKYGWRSSSGKKLLEFAGLRMTDWDERVHDLNSNRILMSLNESEIGQALDRIKTKLGMEKNEDNRPLETVRRLGIQPFSINQAKEWPAEKHKELLSYWTEKSGLEVTLFGSEADRKKLEKMKEELTLPVQLKINLPWPELIGEIKGMDFFLGLDSSLCHLSALLNVPTCILYGLTVPERTIALGRHVLAIQTDYSCCPCYKFADGFFEDCSYHFRCLHNLDARDVFNIIQSYWESKKNNSARSAWEKLRCAYQLKELPFGARLLTIGGRDTGSSSSTTDMLEKEGNRRKPFVSIVVAIRDEADNIADVLEKIYSQDYPQDRIEVIIADGRSQDGTLEILRNFQETHKNLHIVDNPCKIVSSGLNAAIRKSKGEIIARVDGHNLLVPHYIRFCVDELQKRPAANVGGSVTLMGRGVFGKAAALALQSWLGTGGAKFRATTNSGWVDTVFIGTWWRSLFDEVGFFDEELVRNQDDEFNYRLLEKKKKIYLTDKVYTRCFVREKPYLLFKQYFQYGFWKVRVMQKHFKQMMKRHFVPPLFVGVSLGSLLLGFVFPFFHSLFFVIVSIYMCVIGCASLWLAFRNGWKYLFLCWMTYVLQHSGYGLGFLYGLVRFANRWPNKKRIAAK